MRTAKQATVYTCLAVMLAITAFGIYTGDLKVLAAPALAVVLALVNAKHIFEDPDAIPEINRKHAKAIAEHGRVLEELKAEYLKVIAKKDAELCSEREIRIATEDKLARSPKLGLTDMSRLEAMRRSDDRQKSFPDTK